MRKVPFGVTVAAGFTLFLAIMSLIGLRHCAQSLGNPIDPVQLLQGMCSYYAAATSFEADLNIRASVRDGHGKSVPLVTGLYRATMRKPGRLSLVPQLGISQGPVVVFKDREFVYYHPADAEVTVESYSGSLNSIAIDHNVSGVFVGSGNGAYSPRDFPVLLDLLVSKDPLRALRENLREAVHVGQETLAGVPCNKVKLHYKSPGGGEYVWLLFISAGAAPVLLEVRSDLRETEAVYRNGVMHFGEKGLSVSSGGPRGGTIKFSKWKFNQPVPNSRFSFTIPENVTVRRINSIDAESLVGEAAPDGELEFVDGTRLKISSYKGRSIVLLHFWKSWHGGYGAGQSHMKAMLDMKQLFKSHALEIICINLSESRVAIDRFLKEHQLRVRVAMPNEPLNLAYGQTGGGPATFIIDRKGVVCSVFEAFTIDYHARLHDELRRILEE